MPATASSTPSPPTQLQTPQPPPAPQDQGVDKVLSSLEQLGSRAGGDRLDLDFLKDLLESTDFQSLLKLHDKVTTPETPDQEPLVVDGMELLYEVSHDLRDVYTPEAQELLCLLLNPHLKALLEAHDSTALKEFQPELPGVPHEVDEDEESAIKLVRLVKGPNEPLGATINLSEKSGTVKIARVMHGGAADRSGLIHVGDEVQEVNGVQVNGMPPEHVIKLLSNAVGPITLKLSPADKNEEDDTCQESKMRVRAHFSYNPVNDLAIPCKEAGLAFSKGDILHIVSMGDPLWWQARREEDPGMRAALIPSRNLQERRQTALKASSLNNNKDIKDIKNQKSRFSPRLNKKTKKSKKNTHQDEDPEEDTTTYEELALHYPKEAQYRPIVLIGPAGVGRTVLKRRLKEINPDHFQTPIPHTSRPRKSSEVDGNDFFFVSKSEMEKDIEHKKFLEHGEFKGHLYGTSVEQVKSVINEGKVCLLCPQPQAIRPLRNADVKPFIILVKPPNFEQFKHTRIQANISDDQLQRQFTDEEVHEMLQSANQMESHFTQYLDHVIVNEDLQRTVNELGQVLHRLETEPHWIPAEWIR